MADEVSVVIPTHDRDRQLVEALESVFSQTLPPVKVIVSDDRGASATRDAVNAFSARTSQVVQYVDSSGPLAGTAGASRNSGATCVTTPLIAFLDDDDLWHPEFLSSTTAALTNAGADFAVAWNKADDAEFTMTRMREGLSAQNVVARNPGFVGSNFLMKTEAFNALGGFDPELPVSNDKDLLVRALAAGLSYVVVEKYLVINRIHESEQLTDKTIRRENGIRKYISKHRALLSRRDNWFLQAQLASVRRVTAPSKMSRFLSGVTVAVTRTLYWITSPGSE
ncbi:glycosyltransferase [Mangrovimicrobium sediminis]|uniref:Glycosyltransferase n=1 Tax=Mangrovimicrobium sediminis TaxID=2562682 RepID=A0A4Z0LXK0_9GAMM|nr:glycosyltransferase family A protein [Haliea sp. SAOS-164]TGD71878.1 glycosyltransferase [Haliea sp. SAOS-164]